jgi:hypothetical protein
MPFPLDGQSVIEHALGWLPLAFSAVVATHHATPHCVHISVATDVTPDNHDPSWDVALPDAYVPGVSFHPAARRSRTPSCS